MKENFITKIKVNESRNIHNLSVPISTTELKHLIITGKNGSGKTSLLNDMIKFLELVDNRQYDQYKPQVEKLTALKKRLKSLSSEPASNNLDSQKKQVQNQINQTNKWIEQFNSVEVLFNNPGNIMTEVEEGEYLIAFFDAKRHTDLRVPNGITKINLKKKYRIADRANSDFIQHIVNLKADRSFARDEEEMDTVKKIDDWFNQFQKRLQLLFDSSSLQLKFD